MGTTGNVFAVAGRLDDPAHKLAFVSVEEAIRTPVEQSDEKLYIANQAITQEQVLARQQELARGIDRKSVVEGKSVSVRGDLDGRRIIKKKQLVDHCTQIRFSYQ